MSHLAPFPGTAELGTLRIHTSTAQGWSVPHRLHSGKHMCEDEGRRILSSPILQAVFFLFLSAGASGHPVYPSIPQEVCGSMATAAPYLSPLSAQHHR